MKDMVTNGTGNSRYLKSSLASGTSWADALAQLRAGTFPIDLNGLNEGGITQVGSAYSKANVLPQNVCTELGLNETTAEPKDAFLAIVNGLVNLYAWAKYTYASQYATVGSAMDKTSIWHSTSSTGSTYYVQYSYSSSYTVGEDGTINLVNPSTVNVYATSTTAYGYSTLVGKYFKYNSKANFTYISTDLNTSTVYYWPSTATCDGLSNNAYIYVTGLKAVTGTSAHDASVAAGLVERVTSRNASAYPADGKSGNYWYISEGQVGQKAQIQFGSYVGTGTYGSSNQNKIGFAFTPRFVAVVGGSSPTFPMNVFLIYGYERALTITTSTGQTFVVTWGADTVSWYCNSGSSAASQMNASGTTYYYIAIG